MSKIKGECEKGWQCTPTEECPPYKEEESKLETLTSLSSEWLQMVSRLKDLKCNGEENWVCCESGKIKGWFHDLPGIEIEENGSFGRTTISNKAILYAESLCELSTYSIPTAQ